VRNRILEHGRLFFVGCWGPPDRTSVLYSGVKDSEWLYLTPSHVLSVDNEKAVCFLSERTATIYLKRLPLKIREKLHVTSCGVY
jgi:hypothetical protein